MRQGIVTSIRPARRNQGARDDARIRMVSHVTGATRLYRSNSDLELAVSRGLRTFGSFNPELATEMRKRTGQ